MTITDHTFLITLCLVLCAANIGLTADLTNSQICDDGWIYHFDSNTCLKTITSTGDEIYSKTNPCQNHKGGEYRNISGDIINITDPMERFLREYLRFMKISRAVVRSTYTQGNVTITYFPNKCYVDCYRNRPTQRTFVLISLAEELGEEVMCETMSKYYIGQVVCQAAANSPDAQPPSCPKNVVVESVSGHNVTLSMEPGDIRSRVNLRFKPIKTYYNESHWRYPKPHTRSEYPLFLQNLTKYTAVGLLANTHYTIHFDVDNNGCKKTMDITTIEDFAPLSYDAKLPVFENKYQEAKLIIIGLSAALVSSFFIIAVLACLYFRILREGKRSFPVAHSNSLNETDNNPVTITEMSIVAKAMDYDNRKASSLDTATPTSAKNSTFNFNYATPTRAKNSTSSFDTATPTMAKNSTSSFDTATPTWAKNSTPSFDPATPTRAKNSTSSFDTATPPWAKNSTPSFEHATPTRAKNSTSSFDTATPPWAKNSTPSFDPAPPTRAKNSTSSFDTATPPWAKNSTPSFEHATPTRAKNSTSNFNIATPTGPNNSLESATLARKEIKNVATLNSTGSSVAYYTNVQEMPHTYDTTSQDFDDHIYEI